MAKNLIPGEPVLIAPGVKRLVAPNPGMMTGPGTNTYLIGEQNIAVIDPGPAIDKHLEKIKEVTPGKICWVLVTHTHPDHSPGAMPLAQSTGAELMGISAPSGKVQDKTFIPHHKLNDGDSLETEEFRIHAVHTPGHASNHLCFLHEALNWLFTGDHIMNGSTVVIDPPDGNMKHYLESLKRLKTFNLSVLAPGHGDTMDNPKKVIDWLINHRLNRESKVVKALKKYPNLTLHDLTPFVYADVGNHLHQLASRSLLAHLIKLETDGKAVAKNERWCLSS